MLKDGGRLCWRYWHNRSTTWERSFLLASLSSRFLEMKLLTAELSLKSTLSKNVPEIMEEAHSYPAGSNVVDSVVCVLCYLFRDLLSCRVLKSPHPPCFHLPTSFSRACGKEKKMKRAKACTLNH